MSTTAGTDPEDYQEPDPQAEAQKRYYKSEKGKASQERYFKSEKGKAANKRYSSSEKGLEARLRYYFSEKGEANRQRAKDRRDLLAQCLKWLEENPGKTPEDFLKSLREGE